MTNHIALLRLSFPDKALSPNARVHHMALHRVSKKAKEEAWAEALHRGVKKLAGDAFTLTFTFYPPGNYGYDDDNMMARTKPYRDGIAQAMGVDDGCFTSKFGGIQKASGKAGMIVEISGGEE